MTISTAPGAIRSAGISLSALSWEAKPKSKKMIHIQCCQYTAAKKWLSEVNATSLNAEWNDFCIIDDGHGSHINLFVTVVAELYSSASPIGVRKISVKLIVMEKLCRCQCTSTNAERPPIGPPENSIYPFLTQKKEN